VAMTPTTMNADNEATDRGQDMRLIIHPLVIICGKVLLGACNGAKPWKRQLWHFARNGGTFQ